MALWQKLWLLFAVIWIVVAGLNVATIVVFSDEVEKSKAAWPLFLALAVPVVAYGMLWGWFKLRKKSGSDPD